MNEEKKQRIGNMQGWLMVAVAAAVDIVQILLVFFFGVGLLVNRFITIFAFMMFFFWFALNGVSFLTGKMSMKKMTRFFGTAFGEIIPVLGALPLWALGIWLTIRSVREEDKVYNKTDKSVSLRRGLKRMT
tara:strand:- start:359 stop:751 length:393 start_codon:yes stop_codon:yes gene_type:complete